MEHAGLMASMLLFQVGGRSVPIDLTHGQRAFLKTPLAKHLLVFAGLYVMTRSLYGALFLYVMYVMLVQPRYGLLSEHSPFSLLPSWARAEGFEMARRESKKGAPDRHPPTQETPWASPFRSNP